LNTLLQQRSGVAVPKYPDARNLFFRWFALASIFNLYLLHVSFRRWHYLAPPTTHAMSRIFFWAVAVNVASGLLIGWFAIRERWQNGLSLILKLDAAIGLLPFLMGKFFVGIDEFSFRAFGTIYVIFLLLRVFLGLMWLAWNAPGTEPVRHAAIYVFLVTFLAFGGCVPWMWLSSSPQGDEAHFMVLTHSIVVDHDFEVGNNYQNRDFKEEFPPPSPGSFRGYPYGFMQRDGMGGMLVEPHVLRNYRGRLMLQHDMGFPLLLVPGYAVDRREGALMTIALIAAVGAAGIFEFATLLGARNFQALLTVALFGFTTPYYVFSQAALIDLVGAVISLWIALQFFRYRKQERGRYLLLSGILIAILPWLNIRYWSLAGPAFLVLCAWLFHRESGRYAVLIKKLALVGTPSLVSLAVFAMVDKVLFNTYLPNASMVLVGRSMPVFKPQPLRGFLGMMFDGSFGLIPTGPLYVAVAAGMIVMFRRDRWSFAALLLPAFGYLSFLSCNQFWSGGWAAPGRYILSAVTAMVPTAALVLNRKVRWLVGVLAAWSFFISILFAVNSYIRMPSLWNLYQVSMLVELFHDHIHTPFYSILSIFPSFMRAAGRDYLGGFLWLIVFATGAWWWADTAQFAPVHSDKITSYLEKRLLEVKMGRHKISVVLSRIQADSDKS
jgi:hypothetical protein